MNDPDELMRIDEFRRAAGVHVKRSTAACLGPLGATAVFVILALVFFRDSYEEFLSSKFDPVAVEILLVAPMILIFVVGFGSMIPLSRRIDRKFGVPCRRCGCNLAEHSTIVIASRNCPQCGKQVLED